MNRALRLQLWSHWSVVVVTYDSKRSCRIAKDTSRDVKSGHFVSNMNNSRGYSRRTFTNSIADVHHHPQISSQICYKAKGEHSHCRTQVVRLHCTASEWAVACLNSRHNKVEQATLNIQVKWNWISYDSSQTNLSGTPTAFLYTHRWVSYWLESRLFCQANVVNLEQ